MNPLPVNPGVAGSDDALTVNLSHRTMWQGIDGAPRTQYVSIHSPLKKDEISLGLQFFNDQLGVTRKSGIFATGAYRMKLSSHYRLSFGITGGIQTSSNRWSEITTTAQGDQTFAIADQVYTLPQVAAGLYLDGKNAFAGISVPQMLTETYAGGGKYKVTHQFKNYSTHLLAGYRFMLKNQWYTGMSTLLKYHASSPVQTDISLMAGKKHLGEVGITYRFNQSIVAFTQISVNDQLKIGYGFDHMIGGLSQYENGSHEFLLKYTFLYLNKSPNPRMY